jgi:hypothetical protein
MVAVASTNHDQTLYNHDQTLHGFVASPAVMLPDLHHQAALGASRSYKYSCSVLRGAPAIAPQYMGPRCGLLSQVARVIGTFKTICNLAWANDTLTLSRGQRQLTYLAGVSSTTSTSRHKAATIITIHHSTTNGAAATSSSCHKWPQPRRLVRGIDVQHISMRTIPEYAPS